MNLCAGLPTLGNLVRGRTDFVGPKFSKMRALAVEYAKVRTEKFIRGANEEVAIEGTHVDGPVGAGGDGVDEAAGASGASETNNFRDGIDGANGVRGIADGDEFCFGGNFAF